MIKWILVILLATTMFFGCGKSSPAEPENEPPEIEDTHVYLIFNIPADKVLCEVSDPDGLGDIASVSFIMANPGYNDLIYDLYDDGTHGDITSGDGTYTYEWVEGVDIRWVGDGEVNGVGATYQFRVRDSANHEVYTDAVEY